MCETQCNSITPVYLQPFQGIRTRLYLLIDFQSILPNSTPSRLSRRLMVIFRRMELHCTRGNQIHTCFSVIKAGSWYNWWAGVMIATFLRGGLGHVSTLPCVPPGATIEQHTLSLLQTPSSYCNPYLALFSAPDWRPVSSTLSRLTLFSPRKPPSGQIFIRLFPIYRKYHKLSGPLIA